MREAKCLILFCEVVVKKIRIEAGQSDVDAE
jgi:hypothetical protein